MPGLRPSRQGHEPGGLAFPPGSGSISRLVRRNGMGFVSCQPTVGMRRVPGGIPNSTWVGVHARGVQPPLLKNQRVAIGTCSRKRAVAVSYINTVGNASVQPHGINLNVRWKWTVGVGGSQGPHHGLGILVGSAPSGESLPACRDHFVDFNRMVSAGNHPSMSDPFKEGEEIKACPIGAGEECEACQ